uniref:Uncharacterized protein n=1 Tax=Pithovirus LCPAC304 TaxID=2506594 RepID=A0A481ZAC1_9VIRU|nr:MAG: hypothetical protein LCPAC304_04570 [Pithovirus LCPAC304]
MSKNRSKKPNKKQCRWKKEVPYSLNGEFTDAVALHETCKDNVIQLSTGALDPEALDSSSKGKHGAFYVSWKHMVSQSELKIFFDKKTDQGRSKKNIDSFERAQEFVDTYIGKHLECGDVISAELMNTQKRPFNAIATPFDRAAVIPHGSIIACVPPDFYHSPDTAYEQLEALCEELHSEGFVIVDTTADSRYKLKREYFTGESDGKQRGAHTDGPENFTHDGAALCRNQGYCNAPLFAMEKGIEEDVCIANLCDSQVKLLTRGVANTITFQRSHLFGGEKMLNYFNTSGRGKSYKYTRETTDTDIHEKELEFQLKFDGETVLIHKDEEGEVHLMIKFQVDAYMVEQEDGRKVCRFGWI